MRTYIYNAGWMLVEKLIKLVTTFILLALIAKAIGPKDFGTLSISLSIVTVAWCISSLGLENILIKEFAQDKYKNEELFSTAYICRLGISLTLVASSIAILFVTTTELSSIEKIVIAISMASLPFYNYNTYFSYHQAESNARHVTKISLISTVLSSIIKIIIIYQNYGIVAFAISFATDSLLTLILFKLFSKNPDTKIKISNFRKEIVVELSKPAIPLLISSLIVVAYTKLDQFMIVKMLGLTETGIYSVASRIAEAYIFIPVLLATSFYPMLAKNCTKENAKLYFDIVFSSALISGLIILAISPIAIPLLFGEEYTESVEILNILIFSSMFAVLGGATTNYLILKDLAYMRLIRACLGLLVNAVLNYYFIPAYGLIGAAYATLLSQLIAAWLSNALNRKTLDCFKMQTYSILTLGIPGMITLFNSVKRIKRI